MIVLIRAKRRRLTKEVKRLLRRFNVGVVPEILDPIIDKLIDDWKADHAREIAVAYVFAMTAALIERNTSPEYRHEAVDRIRRAVKLTSPGNVLAAAPEPARAIS